MGEREALVMSVQLTVSYDALLGLVDQLPPEERGALLRHLLDQVERRALTDEEWLAAFRACMIDRPIREVPSARREDWYDDGR